MGRTRVTNQPFDDNKNKVSNNSLLNHVVKVNRWYTEEMTIQEKSIPFPGLLVCSTHTFILKNQ